MTNFLPYLFGTAFFVCGFLAYATWTKLAKEVRDVKANSVLGLGMLSVMICVWAIACCASGFAAINLARVNYLMSYTVPTVIDGTVNRVKVETRLANYPVYKYVAPEEYSVTLITCDETGERWYTCGPNQNPKKGDKVRLTVYEHDGEMLSSQVEL
jgi:hypothetical protein